MVAVVVVGLMFPPWALLSGGLIGVGGTWLILLGRQAWLCAQPGQLCGGTAIDMIPWLAVKSAIAIAGLVAGAISVARNRV